MKILSIILLLAACAAQASEPEYWLSTGGVSYHWDRSRDRNEFNPALGLEYRASEGKHTALGGYYRNSNWRDSRRSTDDYSAYLGYRYAPLELGERVRLGLTAGVVTGYIRSPALVVLPTGVVSWRRVGLVIYAAPSVGDFEGGVAVNLMWRLR